MQPLDLNVLPGQIRETLDLLVEWKMPFGRYAGRSLAYLPGEYLMWFKKNGFPSGKLGHLLQLACQMHEDGSEEIMKLWAQKKLHPSQWRVDL